MISADDLSLFHFVDDLATALHLLQEALAVDAEPQVSAFAKSKSPPR
jgi:hypothetical protein